jgi:pimeloyl-ACP methyl ester carboxylesterase
MCTAETLDAQTHALAEQYRVFVPERRGHGRTPDVEGPITYRVMAEDTVAFIEATGLDAVALVGFSDGAMVALLVALERPDLVSKLVLIGQPINLEGTRPEILAMVDSMTADSLPPMLRDLYEAASPDGPEHFVTVFEKLKPALSFSDGGEVAVSRLADVAAPTLVLVGDADIPTIEHAAAMQRALQSGQLGVVPGASHALLWEKPDLANRLLLDFLAG